ncbi:MAG: hypothetical protein ACTSO2_20090 [Promethearchaeota archaeon]
MNLKLNSFQKKMYNLLGKKESRQYFGVNFDDSYFFFTNGKIAIGFKKDKKFKDIKGRYNFYYKENRIFELKSSVDISLKSLIKDNLKKSTKTITVDLFRKTDLNNLLYTFSEIGLYIPIFNDDYHRFFSYLRDITITFYFSPENNVIVFKNNNFIGAFMVNDSTDIDLIEIKNYKGV